METPENRPNTPEPVATNIHSDAYAQPPASSNGMAIASLALGIISLVAVLIPLLGLISWVCAPLGLIFGFIGLGRPAGKGMAVAGLICSALALFLAVAWALLFGALIAMAAAAA